MNPSLAQEGDWKQKVDEFEKVISRVSDSVDDLTAQPDRNPMVNLAGMRQKDDRRNLWFVSAPLIPVAAGEIYMFTTSPLVVAELKSISLAFQASHSQLSQAASYGLRHNVNQVLASPSGVSYGLGETANFFSSWLTYDGIFIPTPGGAAGAVLNNFFPPENIDLDPDD